MTNYNERLEQQLFRALTKGGIEKEKEIESKGRYIHRPMKSIVHEEIEALTSLIKELVAETLKELKEEVIGEVPSKMNTDNWKYDRRVAELKLWQHQAIDNKIKALEDKK